MSPVCCECCCPEGTECCPAPGDNAICCDPDRCCGTPEEPVCCPEGQCCVDGECGPCPCDCTTEIGDTGLPNIYGLSATFDGKEFTLGTQELIGDINGVYWLHFVNFNSRFSYSLGFTLAGICPFGGAPRKDVLIECNGGPDYSVTMSASCRELGPNEDQCLNASRQKLWSGTIKCDSDGRPFGQIQDLTLISDSGGDCEVETPSFEIGEAP